MKRNAKSREGVEVKSRPLVQIPNLNDLSVLVDISRKNEEMLFVRLERCIAQDTKYARILLGSSEIGETRGTHGKI